MTLVTLRARQRNSATPLSFFYGIISNMQAINKILNVYTLVVLNVGIIFAAVFIGNGTVFYTTGIIHIFAIVFVFLAFSSLYRRYYIADPILQKSFLRGTLWAFAIFSLSHVVEFIGFKILGNYSDELWAAVVNFYLLSLCVIIIGAEVFLKRIRRRSSFVLWPVLCLSVFLCISSVWYLTNPGSVSLELDEITPYLYTGATVLVGIFAVVDIRKIGSVVPLLGSFSRAFAPVIFLVVTAALVSIFYEVHDHIEIHEYHLIYLSHFIFYASQSGIYVAFRSLDYVTGVQKEIKNLIEDKEKRKE
ncbi:MAG: hypothetical protein G01um101448_468 [Parcubacteria group bacterium Gr01-1014_48]|nr:MAG: hypothetical protein Greene041614_704 [Parcubacteria group bacterium Greene0416_14]TSC73889.1 MAG: hypothetical protein G01um101448_468 [Parcubacteria group bacterium Gr01-1014_48]TSD01556.1 MAG: hypothetical protein Greene101415_136 [Parcubacteria group bacterium Greene1014_15]TSD08144.1 MAG: hypothetical protein Greene07144_379 [Parcubacteria group bacterium Greene0714_4]